MTGLRNYTAGTRAALQTLSRGSCYYPECGEPVVRLIEGDYYVNYEIAHVRGDQEHGARHDPYMSEADRKAFANLILLCKPHHTRIDRTHKYDYDPETLLKWKTNRESKGRNALAGLTRLTEDTMQEMITEAFAAKQKQIMETLARLEKKNDSEAADLLREMIGELDRFRQYGALIDTDAANNLYRASTYLADMDVGSSAAKLLMMGPILESLPRAVDDLLRAVTKLEGMEGRW